MNKNILAIGIVFLFVCSAFIPMSLGINTRITNTTEQPSTSSLGKTLYAGGTGEGNYTSIQDAINDASDGDTVFVFDDSSPYYENVVVNKSIFLIGEDKDTTIIDGSSVGIIVYINADGVNISGFTIQSDGGNWGDAGIYIQTNNSVISGNKISNNFNGIELEDANNNTVINNDVYSNVEYGLYLHKTCTNNLIKDNFFSENRCVILSPKSDHNFIIDNVFSNNSFSLNILSKENMIINNSFFNDGLRIYSFNNTVLNNTVNGKPIVFLEAESNKIIQDNAGQVILVNCDDITIKNQNLYNTSIGIALFYTNKCTIINNGISNNNYGITLYSSDKNVIANNSVKLNNYDGIALGSSEYNIIRDNICSDNNLGKYHLSGIFLSRSCNNTIINNKCFNNGNGITCYWYSNDNIIKENIVDDNLYRGILLEDDSDNNIVLRNNITNQPTGLSLKEVGYNKIIENNFLNNEQDIFLDIIYWYHLKLFGSIKINGNYWGRARLFPKFMFGDYTFVYMDVPFGGFMTFRWIYIDWNPASEPYDI